jgi:hypothetical protein
MEADSQEFFEELGRCSSKGFKGKFGQLSRRMGLSGSLNRKELGRLYEAAFLAALCNISFNGLGGCDGEIKPEREPTRQRLEQAFMGACDQLYRCAGWKTLASNRKKSIQRTLLTVLVSDENLAG